MTNKPKPWLTPEQQVSHLKSKGVRFDLMDELSAEQYLRNNNNYFRLRSYRVGFPKFVNGANDGKYVNLDFAMLVDLAIIDMHLRDIMLPMTLDIEHFCKIILLGAIEAHGEDGYQIVQDFFDNDEPGEDPGFARSRILEEIRRGLTSPYTSGLIESRPSGDWPAWELMEVIPFGRFIHFWRFCADRFSDRRMLNDFYMLQSVKGLRNGCAHNNCIINDMSSGVPAHAARREVQKALGAIGIKREAKRTKMSNERLIQIATTLYMHQRVSSDGVRNKRGERLRVLTSRIERNSAYYDKDAAVGSGLGFIIDIIRGWYPEARL